MEKREEKKTEVECCEQRCPVGNAIVRTRASADSRPPQPPGKLQSSSAPPHAHATFSWLPLFAGCGGIIIYKRRISRPPPPMRYRWTAAVDGGGGGRCDNWIGRSRMRRVTRRHQSRTPSGRRRRRRRLFGNVAGDDGSRRRHRRSGHRPQPVRLWFAHAHRRRRDFFSGRWWPEEEISIQFSRDSRNTSPPRRPPTVPRRPFTEAAATGRGPVYFYRCKLFTFSLSVSLSLPIGTDRHPLTGVTKTGLWNTSSADNWPRSLTGTRYYVAADSDHRLLLLLLLLIIFLLHLLLHIVRE